MTIWQSVVMGIVEGFTEFLPISSTAHLILTGKLLAIEAGEFLKTYNISIQLGAILAVVLLYWRKILSSKDLILKILTAFIPTSILGLALYKVVKNYLMESLVLIAITLFAGGVFLIVFEKIYQKKQANKLGEIKEVKDGEVKNINSAIQEPKVETDDKEVLSYKQAFIIGVSQTLAMVPGVSRSAATIVSGLWLGLKRKTIVEFSFLLAIPTMTAATFLDLYKSQDVLMNLSQADILVWIIGFVLSFITALIGVKFLLKFIQKNDFVPFGWYRIIIGLAIALFIII